MIHVSIPLPPDLQTWVESQVQYGTYADTAAYLQDLVQRDRAQNARQRLKGLIEEGLASGVIDQDVDEMFDEILAELPSRRAQT